MKKIKGYIAIGPDKKPRPYTFKTSLLQCKKTTADCFTNESIWKLKYKLKLVRGWKIVRATISFSLLFLLGCTPGNRYYLQEDNDYFKPTKNRDVHYTQGIRLGVESPDAGGSSELFAQHIFYTPTHKKESYIPGERPYAGYAAIGYKAHFVSEPFRRVTYGVDGGIVGPHAYAEEVQRTVHKLLGQGYPTGWDAQIDDEAIVNFSFERQHRFFVHRNFDISTLLGANLGNLFRQGYGSSTFRFGHNLPSSFSGGPIYPRDSSKNKSFYSVYGFLTGLVRAVEHNIFLEPVDKKPLVAEVRVGVGLEYEGYQIVYTYIQQTKEFETEERNMDFGEIQLGVVW